MAGLSLRVKAGVDGWPVRRHLHVLAAAQPLARPLEKIELNRISRAGQRGDQRCQVALASPRPTAASTARRAMNSPHERDSRSCRGHCRALAGVGRHQRFDAVPVHQRQVGVLGVFRMTDQSFSDRPAPLQRQPLQAPAARYRPHHRRGVALRQRRELASPPRPAACCPRREAGSSRPECVRCDRRAGPRRLAASSPPVTCSAQRPRNRRGHRPASKPASCAVPRGPAVPFQSGFAARSCNNRRAWRTYQSLRCSWSLHQFGIAQPAEIDRRPSAVRP